MQFSPPAPYYPYSPALNQTALGTLGQPEWLKRYAAAHPEQAAQMAPMATPVLTGATAPLALPAASPEGGAAPGGVVSQGAGMGAWAPTLFQLGAHMLANQSKYKPVGMTIGQSLQDIAAQDIKRQQARASLAHYGKPSDKTALNALEQAQRQNWWANNLWPGRGR